MTAQPEFDLAAAHRYFSAACFNAAWELMEKDERTTEENEQMLRLSLASHWHWTQREDYDATKASIGYWQTSRVYILLNQPLNARWYGRLSLQASQKPGVDPIYQAYAYETLARSAALAEDPIGTSAYLRQAHQAAAKLQEGEDKQQLLADLATVAVE